MTSRLAFWTVVFALAFASRLTAADPDFARDVRPILARYCFKCHGPDDKARKGKLRLDDRDAAVERGALAPGKPDESELVARLFADDPEARMPPAATKLALTDAEKQTLKRWVAAGAEYRQHWAFEQPKRPQIPNTKSQIPIKNPIDAFVFARLEKEGLKPSPEADRHTLIRRVYLDLIGLPPSPAEVDAFLADRSPDAYEKVVDSLLASPHYGERWARRWLDLARYADTNGYEKDRPRSIWPYRDWVIGAINADMPFDRFTVEQLAGDMLGKDEGGRMKDESRPTSDSSFILPPSSLGPQIATGFHRNTMLNEEGGIDPLEFRYHALADRAATTGTVWLGLTVGCAQCHTHKYDPITQHEYYRLFAFLNNADEPEMPVPQPEIQRQRAETEAMVAKLIAELPAKFLAGVDADAAFRAWLWRERGKAVRWRALRPAEATSNLPLLTVQPDDSVFVSGDLTKSDLYKLAFRGDFAGVTAVRVEALPDERLPRGGPGATYYEGPLGDFTLSEIRAEVDGKPAKFGGASHSFAAGKFMAQAAIDGNPQTGWSVNGGQGRRHVAVFTFEKPLGPAEDLRLGLLFERHFAAGLGRFRVSVTTAANAVARETPAEVEAILLAHDAELADAQRARLREHFHLTTAHLAAARKEIDNLRKQLPADPTTLVMRERPPENPRPTFIHNRGEFLQPTDKVEPGTPAFLPPLPEGAPRNRLGFARWLVSKDNPLTARVTVNRQWQAFFGVGLVKTVEDFGFQGELPTHPDLLDWLAVEFVEPTWANGRRQPAGGTSLNQPADAGRSPWSLKRLHKLIVTSATYRQSSRLTPELKEKDPENKLLARGPRVRLEAELIRDAALKAAGLLSPKLGGPSVYPPQPPGVTTEGAYGALPWKPSEGEDRYRRSLYTFAKRTTPFALYAAFDAPSGEACVARRDVSNTPLSALFVLNDVVFLEAAQALGRTVAGQASIDRDRMTGLFRRFVARPPTDAELRTLLDFLAEQRAWAAEHPDEAKKLAGEGNSDATERAAWTATARVLMNLDEFVTKN